MRFSVVIPVYNVAPYLRGCLDSVLAAVERLGGGSWSEELESGGEILEKDSRVEVEKGRKSWSEELELESGGKRGGDVGGGEKMVQYTA